MKVWQVQFPDDKLQVQGEGVVEKDARQVLIDFMVEYITDEIRLVEIEEQADVTQPAEVVG
jgi:hypothetical protein